MLKYFPHAALAAASLLAGASFAAADERPDREGVYTLSFENDELAGDDNNYTSGVRFSYVSPEGDAPDWLRSTAEAFPLFPAQGDQRWGVVIGQNIYTPDDITLATPPTDDQPYAGWLYGTAFMTSDRDDQLDIISLTLGVVGPMSLAEDAQSTVHAVFDGNDPQGWDFQLENEPGIVLGYERKWREQLLGSPSGLGVDVIPAARGNLGNIYTDATLGAIARVGMDLGADYGPPLIQPALGGTDAFRPSGAFGWYLFGGVEGRAVARNIFLDGNTFTDSRSVDKENFVGGLQAGIVFLFEEARVGYTHVVRTDEFTTQRENEEYGVVSLSLRF